MLYISLTYVFQDIGITMATPCNDIPECINGSDESGCESPEWYLYSTISVVAVVLAITCFVSLRQNVKKTIKEIMQDQRWRLATEIDNNRIDSITSEKLMKIAFYAESGNIDEINRLLSSEIRAHGNVSRAMCCLKVNSFRSSN